MISEIKTLFAKNKKKNKYIRIEIRLINKINNTHILLRMKKTDLHL